MGAIYRIYNIETRQSYIGQSDRPYHRISAHLTPGGLNSASVEIQADLLYHPPESWQWEIIADAKDYPLVTLNALECLFIDLYDSRDNGYNIKPGGGVRDSDDTQDETQFRVGLRDKIVSAISDYQKQNWEQLRIHRGHLQMNLMALAELPDSVLMTLINDEAFGSVVQNLEDLKGMIDQENHLKKENQACEQIDNFLSKNDGFKESIKNIAEVLNTELLPQITPEYRPYFFIQVLFQWDGEVGRWSATPRVLSAFDYENSYEKI